MDPAIKKKVLLLFSYGLYAVTARHGDPFSVLGPHEIAPGQWEIRALLPHASRAIIISRDKKPPPPSTVFSRSAAMRSELRREMPSCPTRSCA